MTEQEQIDWLKQVVAKQKAEIDHLSNAFGALYSIFQQPPPEPVCGVCYAVMCEGFKCATNASECQMGVGVSIDGK